MPNHYETLGISNEADENEIKKAYRKLSLMYHPDRNPSEEAKTKILEVNNAYETLSDAEKKKQYNHELQFGSGQPFMHMDSMNEFNDINNIFNMMFNGMHVHSNMPGVRVFHTNNGGSFRAEFSTSFHQPPPTIHKIVEITLEQCYRGCNVPIEIDRWSVVNNNRTNEKVTVNVDIPPGVDESDTLIMRGQGNSVNEQIKGDIQVNIKIINRTIFRRQGLDLIMSKKIPLKEALCGFAFDIPHINGKNFSLNNNVNPSVVSPGFRKIIPNLGMTRENTTGNLIIELEIEFPECLTDEQRKLLGEVL